MTTARGLRYQIKCIEQVIKNKKARGEDAHFEEGLVKEHKRYLPGGDKHYLWIGHSE